jgi:hypothetical protein
MVSKCFTGTRNFFWSRCSYLVKNKSNLIWNGLRTLNFGVWIWMFIFPIFMVGHSFFVATLSTIFSLCLFSDESLTNVSISKQVNNLFLLDSCLQEREYFHMSKCEKITRKKSIHLWKKQIWMAYCVEHTCLFLSRLCPCNLSWSLVINRYIKYRCCAHKNRPSILSVSLDLIGVDNLLDELNDLFVRRSSCVELKTKTWPYA